jgi:hypothetical protein
MVDNQLRVPIVCPTCGRESIAELPLLATFEALEQSCPVLLNSSCHGLVWPATEVEREQLQQYVDAGSVSKLTGDLKSSNS